MTLTPSGRDTEARKKDVLEALEKQGHYWLSSAEVGGRPHVIGVSALWDGSQLVVTTLGSSRTARNMAMNPRVVLAHGDPSDAIVIQAGVIDSAAVEDSAELAGDWKKAMGWDPREMDGWMFFRLRPTRIQAFRGYDEIEGRDVMIRSRWVV
ncbi:MAG TPA: pyridoxamine 5'-phosphate oxidase family protein [Candidatus Dormibacteraeota bacterium]|nr:pyridoxamine 5'-phosphate oxidase family protein [Candidatus Dormibacteraeota bacterium]